MSGKARLFAADIWRMLGGHDAVFDRLTFSGKGSLPSAFGISDLAAGSVASAGLAISELSTTGSMNARVDVDRRLASLWFGFSIRPEGWSLPPAWDPIAGDYRASDGWIKLHTNAPHHRAAALNVMGTCEDKAAVVAAVERWPAADLETAIVSAGGCAAQMCTADNWATHPQGRAVASEPLIVLDIHPPTKANAWQPTIGRPLAGLKILDLTRVLAGPVATRFLAGYGADVLRIDPPGWDEPGVVPEVTLGKRCARLDLRKAQDCETFRRLLSQADVLVHGYRPGALDDLGFNADVRRAIAPDLIDISLSAYGWTGPWAGRRGFDSLVQMSTGIAEAGMRWKSADRPVPLPVQALDHATGYMMAAAVIRALTRRTVGEGIATAKLSLARTAKLLMDAGKFDDDAGIAPASDGDLSLGIEQTTWGPARRISPPISVEAAEMRWDLPATRLGASDAEWIAGS